MEEVIFAIKTDITNLRKTRDLERKRYETFVECLNERIDGLEYILAMVETKLKENEKE